ncbi:MAG: hypothetical protein MKZ81_00520 [Dehalococcoidia bacterium]|nr:hypothetical protein [Dehalococcoidia bacterium]
MAILMGGPWARYNEVIISHGKLVEDHSDPSTDISKKISGSFAISKPETFRHQIRVQGNNVGEFFFIKDIPQKKDIIIHSLIINNIDRGHAYGTKALLAVERKLSKTNINNFWAVLPLKNGRGMYFLLRAGFTPLQSNDHAELNWFIRGGQN